MAVEILRVAGARRNRPIVVLTGSLENLAILAFAAAALEAPPFPIDPSLPTSIQSYLLWQAGDALVIGDDQGVEIKSLISSGASAPLAYAPPQGLALLIATSGSSGAPKAAILTGANLAASAASAAAITPVGPGDRWLANLPLFHIGGFSVLARCAFAGADLVLGDVFDPERTLSILVAERITQVSHTPSVLAQLVAHGPPPRSLRHALVGGASLVTRLTHEAAAVGWPFQPTYEMTETSSQRDPSPPARRLAPRSDGKASTPRRNRLDRGRTPESARSCKHVRLRQSGFEAGRWSARRLVHQQGHRRDFRFRRKRIDGARRLTLGVAAP